MATNQYKDRKVDVMLTGGYSGKLTFGFFTNSIVAGIQKLVQSFILRLFTALESNIFDTRGGTVFAKELWETSGLSPGYIVNQLSISIVNVVSQLKQERSDYPDENIASAVVQSFESSKDTIDVSILITSESGASYVYIFPINISIGIQPVKAKTQTATATTSQAPAPAPPPPPPPPSGEGTPRHATFFHDESVVIAGNSLLLQRLQFYWAVSYQNSSANADEFHNTFSLQKGTYTLNVYGYTDTTSGIIDWYIDSTKIVSAQDWYSASITYETTKTTPGIVISSSGDYTLKGIINGKNVLSSGYNIKLTKYWLVKTG